MSQLHFFPDNDRLDHPTDHQGILRIELFDIQTDLTTTGPIDDGRRNWADQKHPRIAVAVVGADELYSGAEKLIRSYLNTPALQGAPKSVQLSDSMGG